MASDETSRERPSGQTPNQQKVDYPREGVNYSSQKYTVLQTAEFQKWLRKLKDRNARDRIVTRIVRAEAGNLGDHKFFDGIGELRLDYGPGYRLYFAMQGSVVVILLCGGDKGSQERDIKRAIEMSKEI
ncbi:type II toxin-antitoxin system RelE/ParE family toxin [Rhizobium laguerreae]|uniref:type II toxin-antitoxin system RelE/ParE family toxin n=1 Tax=Rhizobium laguerreae TaxID=1076926 RepID=UPI001C908E39|nr:type II toxin-antitoxin system RelE/ParE family toxin [Rhizobium laguerreae]MBY3172306.1 type II toxin-antitoxin system RelE/ParE family toxin [Rhizobium laguerreae]MBY3198719.1 type II toxin-antitoxin system RelE/ParE family toxin [Rhizobium laguerreae]MBY3232110.1 type II toxin-antitoxin system RelE/ParE family toxin [Rhizobium laguerreae]